MKFPFFLLAPVFLMALQSCRDDSVCTDDVVSRVNAGFYVRDATGERDTLLNNFTLFAVQRPDSLLYDSALAVHTIRFPLPDAEENPAGFVLRADSLEDSFQVYFHSNLEMVSFECGFTQTHTILDLRFGNMLLDTIAIEDPLVNTEDEENLKIYLIPAAAVADTSA